MLVTALALAIFGGTNNLVALRSVADVSPYARQTTASVVQVQAYPSGTARRTRL